MNDELTNDKFFNSEVIRCLNVIEKYLEDSSIICLSENETTCTVENLRKLKEYLMEINATEVE